MKVEASTRRANLLLFIGLILFALGLCAIVLLWMRYRTHAQGGRVYPPASLRPASPSWKSTIEVSSVHVLISQPFA